MRATTAPSALLPEGLEAYNGYRRHHCVLIPLQLIPVPSKVLSWLDKVVFGLLRFEARDADRCSVTIGGHEGLAARLGISEDTVQRSIDQLHEKGLVFRKRGQRGLHVIFLRSPLLMPDTATLRDLKTGSDTASLREQGDVSDTATLRELDSISEAAILRDHTDPDTATLRGQIPQLCGSDTATLREPYKERAGALGKSKEASERQCGNSETPPARPTNSIQNGAEETGTPIVTAALIECGVKIQSADEVRKLIELARGCGVDASGLVRFISAKVLEKGPGKQPETARFFLRAVPEDLPIWLKRNPEAAARRPVRELDPEEAARLLAETDRRLQEFEATGAQR